MYKKEQLDSTKIWHPELCKGKVVLITGGSNGGMLSEIGKAYLRHQASAIYFMARKAEKLEAVCKELSQYGKASALPGDVRNAKSCLEVCMKVVEKEGKIDVLVNGAAGNFLASASKMSSNAFRNILEIDTAGTFNMSQACFKASMSKHGGCIINISA